MTSHDSLLSRNFTELQGLLREAEELTRLYAESECKHTHCSNAQGDDFCFRINVEPSHGRSFFSVHRYQTDFEKIREMILSRREEVQLQAQELWEMIREKTGVRAEIEQLGAWFLRDWGGGKGTP